MNSSKILVGIIEMMFPKKVAEIRETNRARRAAMQLMLDTNREMRASGHKADYINNHLYDAMYYYKRGNYQMCILCFPMD